MSAFTSVIRTLGIVGHWAVCPACRGEARGCSRCAGAGRVQTASLNDNEVAPEDRQALADYKLRAVH